jgi:hypothetical protein
MTIVIQHKFWGLIVGEDAFEITLSFNGQGQRLFVPYAAMTSFLDPSVQFGLQFGQDGDNARPMPEPKADTPKPAPEEPAADSDGDSESRDSGNNVVTLDQFRKD